MPSSAPVPAYLDHAATTPVRPEVRAAMEPFLTESFGNPSGIHSVARRAKTALEEAREEIAAALGCRPGEVVVTGGGSEADNLAVIGAARMAARGGLPRRVVVSAVEHKAVSEAAHRLEPEGFSVRVVGVGADGILDLDDLAAALAEPVALVSVMLVNNEVGTIQPLEEIAGIVRSRAPGARLHTDAVQAVQWLDVAAAAAPADLVSVSGHKFGGPKGVGALVVRAGTEVEPQLVGGGQERGLRSGTVDVGAAVGLATALAVTAARRAEEVALIAALRDRFATGLAAVPGVVPTGDRSRVVAGNHHVRIEGVPAELLLLALDQDGVCAAAGSSCASGALEPSPVLAAMGMSRDAAREAVRFSFGYASTDADVDRALAVLPPLIARLRGGEARTAAGA
ncbi:MAG: cysteine desulfurase [Actinobacteria bacterium]|nr:cysteine desulfurase [Actinomycetota bacterium]